MAAGAVWSPRQAQPARGQVGRVIPSCCASLSEGRSSAAKWLALSLMSPAVRQVTSPEQLVDAAPAPAAGGGRAGGKQEVPEIGSDGDQAAAPESPSRRLLRY